MAAWRGGMGRVVDHETPIRGLNHLDSVGKSQVLG